MPSRKITKPPSLAPPSTGASKASREIKRPRGRPPLPEGAKSATERGQAYRERKRAEGVAELLLRVPQRVIPMLDDLCTLKDQTRSEVVADLIVEAKRAAPRKRKRA